MPYVVPAAADLVARFPAFAAVSTAVIGNALVEAQTRVDESWMPGDYTIAIMLLAAHTLTLDGQGASAEAALAAAGALGFRSLHSGALSLDRDPTPSDGTRPSLLEQTSYGRRFLALLRVNQPAIVVP